MDLFRHIRLTPEQFARFDAIAPKERAARIDFLNHFIDSALETMEIVHRLSLVSTAIEGGRTKVEHPADAFRTRSEVTTLIHPDILAVESTDEIIARLDNFIALASKAKRRNGPPTADKDKPEPDTL